LTFDELVKSRFYPVFVIPEKAGIQLNQAVLGSRLRGSDGFSDFLRVHQSLQINNGWEFRMPKNPF